MSQAGAHQQGFSPVFLIRSHSCKLLVLVFVVFLFMQYATNLIVYKQHIGKVISPGLTWVSYSIQKKLGLTEKLMYHRSSAVVGFLNMTFQKNSSQFVSNMTVLLNASQVLPLCPLIPPKLVGPLKVLTNAPSFEELEQMFVYLTPGGRYRPPDCTARHKVAIVVPYRDREEHLRIFLHNLHPILQRQQLNYGIYIIEEAKGTKFNRAMLMNIGFVEALKQYNYTCFIFHDVDLIPEDDRNLYWCGLQPRHMSVAINTMNYRLPYIDIFGGVSALSQNHMKLLNGFSNEFWGWGGEDDDMSNRIKYHGLKIIRYSSTIARYTMLKHHKDEPNPERYNKLHKGKSRFKKDGLSNLKYNRVDLVLKKLFTWILVEIEPKK